MSERPTYRDLQNQHEDERARYLRERRAVQVAEERWQRRILPLLSNDAPAETDFRGCFG